MIPPEGRQEGIPKGQCPFGAGLGARSAQRLPQPPLSPPLRPCLHRFKHLVQVAVEAVVVAWDDDDRVHELYSYDIDRDGHGLTIHTHKGGSVMVYFKAGPPVNRDTLALLVIDP